MLILKLTSITVAVVFLALSVIVPANVIVVVVVSILLPFVSCVCTVCLSSGKIISVKFCIASLIFPPRIAHLSIRSCMNIFIDHRGNV